MTAQRLPSWVVEPLDMNGAAAAIGVCRRTFIVIIAEHPHYELRGRKKVFYPEHITLFGQPRPRKIQCYPRRSKTPSHYDRRIAI